jgi:hypothetical protein
VTAEEVLDHSGDLCAPLARPLPEGFSRSVLVVDVGGSLSCASASVRGALLLVTSGAIDVEAPDGSRFRFCAGAVLSVSDLPHCELHNSGREVAHVVAVRRSGAAEHRGVESPRVQSSVPGARPA